MFNHLFRWGLNDESFQCAGSNVEVKGCETQNRALGKPLFEMCCVHFPLGEGGGERKIPDGWEHFFHVQIGN